MSSPIQVENTARQLFFLDVTRGSVFKAKDTAFINGGARLASGEVASLEGGYHMNLEISNASLNLTGDIVTANCSFNNTLHNESIDVSGTVGMSRCTFWGGVAIELYDRESAPVKDKDLLLAEWYDEEEAGNPVTYWKVFALRYWAKEIQEINEKTYYRDDDDLINSAKKMVHAVRKQLHGVSRFCLAPNVHPAKSCVCGLFLPHLFLGSDLAMAYFIKSNPALADTARGTIFESISVGQIRDTLLAQLSESASDVETVFTHWHPDDEKALSFMERKLQEEYGLGGFGELLRTE